MDQLNQLLQAELDQEALLKKKEAKQQKGFTPEGLKQIFYLGENLLQVQDGGGGSDYLVSFLEFKRIVEIYPFKERSLKRALSSVLAGYTVFFDFNQYKLGLKDDHKVISPLGGQLKTAKEEYNPEDFEGFNTLQDEINWNSFINKN